MTDEQKLLISALNLLRDRRKLNQQTDAEFELEGIIADYLKDNQIYDFYLELTSGKIESND